MEAPLERNIPVLMALLGIWYRDIWGFAAHAVIPYDERMARFPAYLQQLEMESNGKSVDLDGVRVRQLKPRRSFSENRERTASTPSSRCLHQGTEIVPIDFLVAARPLRRRYRASPFAVSPIASPRAKP